MENGKMNFIKLKSPSGNYEGIPLNRVYGLSCDETTCTIVYAPVCTGEVEKTWIQLADATRITEMNRNNNRSDPKYEQEREKARNDFVKFQSVHGCGWSRLTRTFDGDDLFNLTALRRALHVYY